MCVMCKKKVKFLLKRNTPKSLSRYRINPYLQKKMFYFFFIYKFEVGSKLDFKNVDDLFMILTG